MATRSPECTLQDTPVGLVFGRLTVTEHWRVITRSSGKRERKWRCLCACGATAEAYLYDLRSGRVMSCGCLRKELVQLRQRTHGASANDGSRTKTYSVWAAMKQRCLNPKCKNYSSYGGRGITLDPAWYDFSKFLADMGDAPFGHSIERIDNNKGYCKDNCKWIPREQQARNTRRTVIVSTDSGPCILRDALAELGKTNAQLRHVMRKHNVNHQQGIDILWQMKKKQQ